MLLKCNRMSVSCFLKSFLPVISGIDHSFCLGSFWLSTGITPVSTLSHPPGSPPGPLLLIHIRNTVEGVVRGTVDESPLLFAVPLLAMWISVPLRAVMVRGIDSGFPLIREVPNLLIPHHPAFLVVPLPKDLLWDRVERLASQLVVVQVFLASLEWYYG